MGLIFMILDLFNPRVKTTGRVLDGAVDLVTRRGGITGNIIGYFARKAINRKYRNN